MNVAVRASVLGGGAFGASCSVLVSLERTWPGWDRIPVGNEGQKESANGKRGKDDAKRVVSTCNDAAAGQGDGGDEGDAESGNCAHEGEGESEGDSEGGGSAVNIDAVPAEPPIARYLFNASEGTQRLFAQYKVKSASIKAVMLTRVNAQVSGGLAGVNFALSDTGAASLSIRGPVGTKALVESFQPFIPRRWPELNIVEVQAPDSHRAKFNDLGPIQILCVTIHACKQAAPCSSPRYCHWCNLDGCDDDEDDDSDDDDDDDDDKDDGDSDDDDDDDGDDSAHDSDRETKNNENINQKSSADLGGAVKPLSPAISYILRCWSKVGYDGKTAVKTSQSFLVAVVDCPSKDYISSLCQSVHFRKKAEDEKCLHRLSAIFHLAPASVIRDARYKSWMSMMGSTRHILVHYSNNNNGCAAPDPFPSSARWSSCLRVAAPKLYPATCAEQGLGSLKVRTRRENLRTVVKPSAMCMTGRFVNAFIDFSPVQDDRLQYATILDTTMATDRRLQATQLSKLVARIKESIKDDANEIDIDDDGDDEKAEEKGQPKENASVDEKMAQSSSNSRETHLTGAKRTRNDEPSEDPHVCFLGTGSAKPATIRGCSAILVSFANGSGYALLDVGEGAFGQLLRLFGMSRAREIVENLHWIWVSHHHLDHHGGLGKILELFVESHQNSQRNFPQRQLLIIGPPTMRKYLEAYCDAVGISSEKRLRFFQYVHCLDVGRHIPGARSCYVDHCKDAFALAFPIHMALPENCQPKLYRLQHQEQQQVPPPFRPIAWLIYSGDTRPCPEMWRKLSAPVDRNIVYSVLIHEATFDNSRQSMAQRKRHSTTGEAMQAAAAMRADLVILTHFSQRYPKIMDANDDDNGGQDTQRQCILLASDLMSVPLEPSLESLKASAQSLALALERIAVASADLAKVEEC